MRVVHHFTELDRPCTYLEGRAARLEEQVLLDVTPEELEARLSRGWRHFGPAYFRPRCAGCGECVSLRLPVERFSPTESQRRALRRARQFRAEWQLPRIDPARLALYATWHRAREEKHGWESSPLTAREYWWQFAFPHPAARELALYQEKRLVMVGLYDETPQALSAVYCFYHPEIARLSPGVANVMLGVERARAGGKEVLYLGYRVEGCPSLRYKSLFGPHQVLRGRPEMDEEPEWVEPGEDRG